LQLLGSHLQKNRSARKLQVHLRSRLPVRREGRSTIQPRPSFATGHLTIGDLNRMADANAPIRTAPEGTSPRSCRATSADDQPSVERRGRVLRSMTVRIEQIGNRRNSRLRADRFGRKRPAKTVQRQLLVGVCLLSRYSALVTRVLKSVIRPQSSSRKRRAVSETSVSAPHVLRRKTRCERVALGAGAD